MRPRRLFWSTYSNGKSRAEWQPDTREKSADVWTCHHVELSASKKQSDDKATASKRHTLSCFAACVSIGELTTRPRRLGFVVTLQFNQRLIEASVGVISGRDEPRARRPRLTAPDVTKKLVRLHRRTDRHRVGGNIKLSNADVDWLTGYLLKLAGAW